MANKDKGNDGKRHQEKQLVMPVPQVKKELAIFSGLRAAPLLELLANWECPHGKELLRRGMPVTPIACLENLYPIESIACLGCGRCQAIREACDGHERSVVSSLVMRHSFRPSAVAQL